MQNRSDQIVQGAILGECVLKAGLGEFCIQG